MFITCINKFHNFWCASTWPRIEIIKKNYPKLQPMNYQMVWLAAFWWPVQFPGFSATLMTDFSLQSESSVTKWTDKVGSLKVFGSYVRKFLASTTTINIINLQRQLENNTMKCEILAYVNKKYRYASIKVLNFRWTVRLHLCIWGNSLSIPGTLHWHAENISQSEMGQTSGNSERNSRLCVWIR